LFLWESSGDCEDRAAHAEAEVNFKDRIASYLSRSGRRLATGAAVLIAVMLGYHITFGANGLTDYQQKRNQHEQLQKEIVALQEQNSRLQDHVNHLKSDPDAIEHEARVIMRYAKPGEVIYEMNHKPAAK
jgi:cell division protein FtsB